MKINNILKGLAGVVAIAGMTGLAGGWYLEHRQVTILEGRVADLQKQEQRSAIDKSVSEQLGVIASQQKDIAEERREEAMKEKQRADDAFERSEKERKKAEIAEYEARQEKDKAEQERRKADEARRFAEASEQVAKDERIKADSLRYQALGRSLGAASRQAFQANQLEKAQLLAYYSYYFTKNYGGVVYVPDVFQALLNASHSITSWSKHRGIIRGIDFMPKSDGRLVTVCDYGAILIHTPIKRGYIIGLKTDTLYSDKSYDFRNVYVNHQGLIYVISNSGNLLVCQDGDKRNLRIIHVFDHDNPISFWAEENSKVIMIGKHSLAEVDLNLSAENMVIDRVELPFTVTAQRYMDGKVLLFDDQHRQHLLKDIHHYETSEVPVKGKVTTFSSTRNLVAYGMEDGSIYLGKRGSKNFTQLLGHESRISQLKMSDELLYSSGYDGKVNFWYINNEKIEPMELISKQNWVMDFTLSDDQRYIWMGDKNGYVTAALLDVEAMKNIIETELKGKNRDLDIDEWNYYIGRNTPYQPIIKNSGKEVRR